MRISPGRSVSRGCLLGFALLLAATFALPAAAAPRRPQLKWPDLRSHENRLRMLEQIGQMFERKSIRSIGYDSRDLDEELSRYLARNTSTPLAPVVDDETFLRRVMLDLIGRTPTPQQIEAFVADDSADKRAKKIDQLLASDAWARKWARYWRSVIFHDSPGMKNQVNPQALENWLAKEFDAGQGWDDIVAEMLSAVPQRRKGAKVNENPWNQDTGSNNFVLSSAREPEQLAARTARIFMGISIECAECHDHPFEDWRREQFHELAAFFAPGKYRMDDEDDPSEQHVMQPRFLLGEKPPENLKQDQRRVLIAAYLIYNPDNYWFARSYVNRVWSELIGDGFYAVDSLGPDKEVLHKLLVNKIAAQFRAEGFDNRWLFRLICNSEAYQRDSRSVSRERDYFTSVRPTRLRPWEILERITSLGGDPLAKNRGLKTMVARTFEQNPSTPHRSLEGTVQQALLLMNNAGLNSAVVKSDFVQRLKNLDDDAKVIDQAFLTVLARHPDDDERERYSRLLESGNRAAAIEDLVWVLMNSAEFLTKT